MIATSWSPALFGGLLVIGVQGLAFADPVNRSPFSGLAIHGYDPVAYFTDHAAVPGDREILYEHQGVTWAFASVENRELFRRSPQAYIPKYGGFCAYAASQNAVSDADPTAWQLVDGKLYLNYDKRVQRTWANRIRYHIDAADANWPGLAASIPQPDS